MIKTINIKSWNRDIMIVAEIGGEIIIDLEDMEFSQFSPLKFEETMQIRERISRNDEIDSIGILSDSISGSYGKGYFNKYFINEKGEMPSILDRLSFIGSDGLGALEFSTSDDFAVVQNSTFSLKDFKQLSIDVYNGASSKLATLIAKSNSGAGGAKAKAVVQYNCETKSVHLSEVNENRLHGYTKSIMKFNNSINSNEIKKYNDELKMEFVYYLLARESGINISDSWLESDDENNYYFITKRFDVDDEDTRFHMHSLAGILSHNASSFTLGYESLFRVGTMLGVSEESKRQMFKTMVFNLVFANRDDHSRNFSFLMDKNYNWEYAPSYDLTYSGYISGLKSHQLTIDKKLSHLVRSLAITKIAKLCNEKNPLMIFENMIELKHSRLGELAKKYDIESVANAIFEDTKAIDKIFGSRS